MTRRQILAASVLIGVTASLLSAQAPEPWLKAAGTPVAPKVDIRWDRYYDSEALEALSEMIATAYPNLAKVQSVGKSREGRDIWCLTITDFSKGDPARKPGTYVQANIHGNEIQGGEFALYTAWYLTESFADTRAIRELLADKVLYIVPTLNPDSRDSFIHRANSADEPRGPANVDFGYRDLDGDGNIVQMRVKDQYGIWRIDPNRPDRMLRLDSKDILSGDGVDRARQPDPANYDLMDEGAVGKDGKAIESESRNTEGNDPNRDWGWDADGQGEESQPARPPFSFPETRAARDFMVGHPNIAAAFSLHNFAGQIYSGMVRRGMWDTEANSVFDDETYRKLAKRGESLMPGYKYVTANRGLPGREIDWMFARRGAYAFIIELWTERLLFGDAPEDWNARMDERDAFDREVLSGDGFVPWHKAHDPVLGDVEVGGWKKNSTYRLDPGFMLEEDAHRTMAFCLYVCRETPKLEITRTETENVSDGSRLVTAAIENTGVIATHSGPDLRWHIARPDYVTLRTSGEVVKAEQILWDGEKVLKVIKIQDKNPTCFEAANIPGGDGIAIRWTVRGGSAGEVVTVDSVKGGVVSAPIELSASSPR